MVKILDASKHVHALACGNQGITEQKVIYSKSTYSLWTIVFITIKCLNCALFLLSQLLS